MLISDGTIRGKIEPISAVIRQEINGEYSCDVEIALSDELAGYFDIDAIVYLDDANGTVQQFRLERPEKTLDSLRAFGWHISQDLAHDMILNNAWITQTGASVLPDLLTKGISETRFTGTSDITSENSLRIVRKSVLNALIGDDDNTFLNRWGGEIERDNFTVNMKQRLGAERGYRIAYKKNLTGIEIIDDASTIVNRIVPTFLGASGGTLLLPEVYIDSPRINQTPIPHCMSIHYGDIQVGAEVDEVIPYPTLESAQAEVRNRIEQLYLHGADQPALTVDVQFVQLRNTLEYADFAMLETVLLGDTIRADYEDYTVTNRVVAYEWDAVLKRYNKIILGTVRPSVDAMTASIATQVANESAVSLQRHVTSLVLAIAELNQSVANASGMFSTKINNADGSFILYYHDAPTLETSQVIEYYPEPGTRVWTDTGWNEGLPSWKYGYDQHGLLVMRLISTVGLNADWITSGQINTNLITIGGEPVAEVVTELMAGERIIRDTIRNGGHNILKNPRFGGTELPDAGHWLQDIWTGTDI